MSRGLVDHVRDQGAAQCERLRSLDAFPGGGDLGAAGLGIGAPQHERGAVAGGEVENRAERGVGEILQIAGGREHLGDAVQHGEMALRPMQQAKVGSPRIGRARQAREQVERRGLESLATTDSKVLSSPLLSRAGRSSGVAERCRPLPLHVRRSQSRPGLPDDVAGPPRCRSNQALVDERAVCPTSRSVTISWSPRPSTVQ